LGIVVSLILFLVGYRQTVGAKKERASACNAELEKILVRRLVLERYSPTRTDVERLIEGKARDFRVSSDDLLSSSQVLNAVYTRVVESELISAEQRVALIEMVLPALTETESNPLDELQSALSRGETLSATTAAMGILALVASAMGGLVAILPDLTNLTLSTTSLLRTSGATGIASLIVIGTLVALYRIRASWDDGLSKSTEADQYVRLEGHVASTLRKLGYTVRSVPLESAGDFLIERGDKKYLVDVKAWVRRPPARLLEDAARRLQKAAADAGAERAILVSASPLNLNETPQVPNVSFVTPRALAAHLEAIQRPGAL
jgi:hypothetical protein